MANIDRQSQERRLMPVTAVLPGGAPADITADAVYIAVIPRGVRPTDADWVLCAWSTDVQGSIVVPLNLPGGFSVSTPGEYRLWIKINDGGETPLFDTKQDLDVT